MNKLTDNETIKALEEYLQKCQNIKYGATQKILVDADFLKDVLDLINRKQAKIKELEGENLVFMGGVAYFKSEAIKEFASRLKCGVPQETGVIRCADVDNLVKEMVGE